MSSPVLGYYDFGPGVRAFSTTRHGGAGSGAYGGFNINPYCGDEPEAVAANRDALCRMLGIAASCLVLPHQTHGTAIRRIGEDFAGLPAADREALLEGVDAVMTDVAGVCVGVSTADCIPVLLHDAIRHVCCAVHAGWRGTVAGITARAVAAMADAYGCVPDTLTAWIGPGISVENFEVGDEVYSEFAAAGFDMGRVSRRYAKWHIDLWECNRMQLEQAGVCPQSIHVAGVCTYSHADDYFSARRLGAYSGRIFTGIMETGNVEIKS